MYWKLENPVGIQCNRFGYEAVDVMVEEKLVYRAICFGQAIDLYRELVPLGYDILLYPANSWVRNKSWRQE